MTESSKIEEDKHGTFYRVESIDGLFDEESAAITRNIRDKKFCIKHKLVNASLYWADTPNRHVSVEGKDWGSIIRYCVNCKWLDCLHHWGEEITYRIYSHKFYYSAWFIKTCKFCEKRIKTGGCGVHDSTVEAFELIAEVAKSYNKEWTGDPAPPAEGCKMEPTKRCGYGSNWYTILPSTTSRILADEGREMAKLYVQGVFMSGVCE